MGMLVLFGPAVPIYKGLYMCVCFCDCPRLRKVCLYHEVLMFRPWTVTPLKPRLCHLLLYILLLNLTPPSSFCPVSLWGGIPLLTCLPIRQHFSCCCTGSSAHPGITHLCPKILITPHLPLACRFQIPNPPLFPRPRHACRILVAAAPLLLPKFLLTSPSAVFHMMPATTTAPGASPLTCIPSPLRIPLK